jgi:autotransporter-associated beta strand protein
MNGASSSTYTGGTQIVGANLIVATNNALPTDTVVTLGDAGGLTGVLRVNGGITQTIGGLQVATGAGASNSNQVNGSSTGSAAELIVNASSYSRFTGRFGASGAASQNINLTKQGPAAFTLSNTVHTFTGSTTVSGGTLEVDGTGNINSGSGVTINGGRFLYNSSVAYAKPITFTSGTIGGTGNINTAVSIGAGDTISPGGDVDQTTGTFSEALATQNYQAGLTFAPDGTYRYDVIASTGRGRRKQRDRRHGVAGRQHAGLEFHRRPGAGRARGSGAVWRGSVRPPPQINGLRGSGTACLLSPFRPAPPLCRKDFAMTKRLSQFARVFLIVVVTASAARAAGEPLGADVVVYGGTPGGIMTAVALGRAGRLVLLIEPQVRVGGMVSGGLCKSDVGKRETIGGLSKEFFTRVNDHYVKAYGADSKQVKDARGGELPEPKVAEQIYNEMLAEVPSVKVLLKHRFVEVQMKGDKVVSVTVIDLSTNQSVVCTGKMFVDAGYEGDLMAYAGVPYRVGREAQSEYNESFAGVTNPAGGRVGLGDHRVQAYNIRGTITNRPDLCVPFPKPKHYNPKPFRQYIDGVKSGRVKTFKQALGILDMAMLTNGKYDPNVADYWGPIVQSYPEGNAQQRHAVYERVRDHWLSLFWMLQNDPELSESFRASAMEWGLPKDEFVENGHITPQVYVRVARRMIGQYVMTQNDLRSNRYKPTDGVCIGSYTMDSHAIQELAAPGKSVREGQYIELADPYEIPYGVLVPPNVKNLLVVGAVSATHVAYSSVRMEPVFMMLGHAAGAALDQALTRKVPVQDVDVAGLRKTLRDQKALLDAPYRPVVEITASVLDPQPGQAVVFELKDVDVRKPLKRIWWNFDGTGAVQGTERTMTHTFAAPKVYDVTAVAEDVDGKQTMFVRKQVVVGGGTVRDIEVTADEGDKRGAWRRTRARDYDFRLLHTDDDQEKGEKSVVFPARVPKPGRYAVAVAYAAGPNRASDVPVEIRHGGGVVAKVTIDQRKAEGPFVFKPVGEFTFNANESAEVEIRTDGTRGDVVVDAVKWVWLGS